MNKISLILLFSLIFYSCEKDNITPGDEYNLQGTGKIKTKYIYSSSSDNEPYATNSYSYDGNWNLKKILISDNPKPVFASYTYEYSDLGVLLNMKYTYEGSHVIKVTESDQNGSIMMENTYSYSKSDEFVIVEFYNKDFLSEKTTYKDGNVIEYIKYHPTFQGAEWFCYRYEYY